VNTNEERLI
jgi:hypothetical protein